jgi:hypothetical protein
MNTGKINFERKIYEKILVLKNVIKKDKNIYQIAGVTSQHLYFSTIYPGNYLETNLSLEYLKQDYLEGRSFQKRHISYQMFIDSPHVYLCIGNYRKIYIASFPSGAITDSVSTHYIFTRSAFMPPVSFALRCFDTIRPPDQIFVKVNLANRSVQRENHISPKMGDAGISTDGLLYYDTTAAALLFCHFYNDEALEMNDNLQKKRNFYTIDMSDRSLTIGGNESLKGAPISKYTNITPRYFNNSYSWVSQGKLLVASKIRHVKEFAADFGSSTAIDIYDIKTGAYQYSFHLPNYKGEDVAEFVIFNHLIIALYRNYIATYQLLEKII